MPETDTVLQMGWWDWIGIIVAAVALLMAAPSFVQIILGRPKVIPQFDRHVEGVERVLLMFIKNPPITTHWLSRLYVRRDTVQSLTVTFRIAEVGSGRIIIPFRESSIYS